MDNVKFKNFGTLLNKSTNLIESLTSSEIDLNMFLELPTYVTISNAQCFFHSSLDLTWLRFPSAKS